jgi:hypothetical protein
MYGHRVVSVRRTQRPPTPTVHAAQLVFLVLFAMLLGDHHTSTLHTLTRLQDLGELCRHCAHKSYVVGLRRLAIRRAVFALESGTTH